jgi:hypothetical protein
VFSVIFFHILANHGAFFDDSHVVRRPCCDADSVMFTAWWAPKPDADFLVAPSRSSTAAWP